MTRSCCSLSSSVRGFSLMANGTFKVVAVQVVQTYLLVSVQVHVAHPGMYLNLKDTTWNSTVYCLHVFGVITMSWQLPRDFTLMSGSNKVSLDFAAVNFSSLLS